MIIAIDPDMKKPGVCFLNNDEIHDLCSMTFYDLVKMIERFKDADYVLEDVNKIGAIYQHNRRANKAVAARIAQNVGMVKASATIIHDLIEAYTGRPPALAPVGLGKQVKNNAKLFKQLTGWQRRTNEDTRDAAAIAIWYSKQLAGHTTTQGKV